MKLEAVPSERMPVFVPTFHFSADRRTLIHHLAQASLGTTTVKLIFQKGEPPGELEVLPIANLRNKLRLERAGALLRHPTATLLVCPAPIADDLMHWVQQGSWRRPVPPRLSVHRLLLAYRMR